MHEIGLCEGLLELVEQRAAGREVAGVRLRIGAAHAVLDDAFDQAFALVAAGTVAASAAVDLVVTPLTVSCSGCGRQSESLDALAVCAHCESADVDVSGGDEMVLESLEFARADAPTGSKEVR